MEQVEYAIMICKYSSEVMIILEITRYSVKNKCLAPWVKFFWHLKVENADYHYKLLPTDCIDVILNLKSNMIYETDYGEITAPSFHINGLRSKANFIRQINKVCIFGISFYPYGLYPFIHKPIIGLQDNIMSLQELSPVMSQKLKLIVTEDRAENIITAIEQCLVEELVVSERFLDKAELIHDFLTVSTEISVGDFCRNWCVNMKSFERMVLMYTGFTPKLLRDIKRFQNISNQLSFQRADNLAAIAYDNDFTDQTHFIKTFRRFSGVTPRTFQKENITVKENVLYTYQ